MTGVLWIFLIIGVAVAFVPRFIADRYTWHTQADLARKLPAYENINLSFIGYFSVFFILTMSAVLFLVNLEQPYSAIFAPVWFATVFSGLGITYGLFAVRKGVYPVSKYFFGNTKYAYSQDDKVVRLGRIQIIASLSYFMFSILASLIRLLIHFLG